MHLRVGSGGFASHCSVWVSSGESAVGVSHHPPAASRLVGPSQGESRAAKRQLAFEGQGSELAPCTFNYVLLAKS